MFARGYEPCWFVTPTNDPEREKLVAEVRVLAGERGVPWMREILARTGGGHLREFTTQELRFIAAA